MNPAFVQDRPRPLLATHVITRLIVGGAQENTISTILGLQKKPEFQTDLVAGPTAGREGTLEPEYRSRSDALTILPTIVRPIRPLIDLKGLFDLRRHFLETRPAIVHTHSGKAGVLGRWAAHMAKVPIIIHGVHGPSFGPWQGPIPNALFRSAEQSAGRVTSYFVAVAQAMVNQYLAAGIGRPEMYERVFSGFPLEPFLAAHNDPILRQRYGIKPEHFVIGKIARMCELKGHDDLFEVAPDLIRKFPHVRFLLVGGGPWEDRFRKRAAEAGLSDQFIFTGLVAPREIPSLAGIMDVLVHLSYREGLPRALPQAMAAGKPVVAFDSDGAGEVCITGQTGFLVAPRNHPSLFEALSSLILNRDLGAKLGRAGRDYVRERFPVERMVDDTYRIYVRLLRERHLLAPG